MALFLEEVVGLHVQLYLVVEKSKNDSSEGIDVPKWPISSGHLIDQQTQQHVVKL